MNRLKLVCIIGALIFLLIYMCSCVTNVEAKTYQNGYNVTVLYRSFPYEIVRVNTPSKSYTVAVFNRSGSVVLN